MNFADVPTLQGKLVTLEPLAREHVADLASAAGEDDLWRTWYTRIPAPGDVQAEIDRRLALRERGELVPWSIRSAATGAVVGMTTFLNLRPEHRRLEIGSTWIARSAQRTGINREAKLLQLSHAFETLGAIAVEFRTHWHNHQSRRAIAALGAKQDGVLRNHDLWRDGTVRDVVVFSIIDREWPTVRLALTEGLNQRTEPIA